MPQTTPKFGFRFPESGDPSTTWVYWHELALDVEGALDSKTIEPAGDTTNGFKAEVKISDDTDNQLTLGSDGALFVPKPPAPPMDVRAEDTATVTLEGNGTQGTPLAASTVISGDDENALAYGSDGGLYVPPQVKNLNWTRITLDPEYKAGGAPGEENWPEYAVRDGLIYLRGQIERADGAQITSKAVINANNPLPDEARPYRYAPLVCAVGGVQGPTNRSVPWLTRLNFTGEGVLEAEILTDTSSYKSFYLVGIVLAAAPTP